MTAPNNPLREVLGFPLSEEDARFGEEVRAFARETIAPFAEVSDQSDADQEDLEQAIREARLFDHFVPVEYGGKGLSVTKICLIREALAYSCITADEFLTSQGIAAQAIIQWGTEEQKRDYLDGLRTGRRFLAFCLTEPGAGSDVRGIRTAAERVTDGYLLNGVKRYVYRGDSANSLLVFAKLGDPNERGPLSAFLFDRPEAGCTARPFPLLFPGPEFELVLEDCLVPPDSLFGGEGKGTQVALGNLDRLRPSVGAASLGMAQRALDEAITYVHDRQAYGGPLSDLQVIRFKVAEAATRLSAARLMVYAAARHADRNPADGSVRASSAAAKVFASETAQFVVDTALQVHGGAGLARGSITERLYKAVRATRIYEGSTEVMQVVIGRSIFGRESTA